MVSSDDSVVVISRQRTGEFSQGASAIASNHNSAPAGTGRPGQALAYSRRSNSNTLHVSTPTADTLTNGTIHGGLSIEEDALAIEKRRHQEVRKLLKSTETRIEPGQTLAYSRRSNSNTMHVSTPTADTLTNGTINGGSIEDGALALEKERHQEVRRLLKTTEARIEQLQQDIDDKNNDIEEYKGTARELEDQLGAASTNIANLEDRVATLGNIETEVVMQADKIAGLQEKLRSETTARKRAELQATNNREELEKMLLMSDSKLDSKQEEIDSLRAELASAKEAILARDEALRKSDKEKKDLQTSLFDLKHQMENATAVMGEASMALHSEVTKFLSSLQSTNKLELPLPTMPRR